MNKSVVAVLLFAVGLAPVATPAQAPLKPLSARERAARVTIVRDQWGIAHVYGKSDADTVFGAIYAQAEDDFKRIERNYLVGLGRLAEAEGESAVYADLRQRLFVDPARLRSEYVTSPNWLKALMSAWAEGLNYYLATHPNTHPLVLKHFEPWMALSFTEGSIGGDIESVDLGKLRDFYATQSTASTIGAQPTITESTIGEQSVVDPLSADSGEPSPGGSNGFAIAPSRSATGHALLWINPHTSFYFRAELQMVSDEGLDVYGAATWGQFFIYQGFNAHNGWMHTSYGGDAIDEYAETIVRQPEGLYYRYGSGVRKLEASHLRIAYKQGSGSAYREFTVYHSHHGPIVRAEHGKWIAVKLLQDPVPALAQSYLRTKTTDYASFRKTQEMRTDTSNNTVYADGDGSIAYFHGNFIPKRDPAFDYTHPVDGSNPATEWQGPHALDETITLLNPSNGWIANTNNWPFSAAGDQSPKKKDYPAYMWIKGENPRGIHAAELLKDIHDVTLDSLIKTAYDGHLTAFDVLLPPLLQAYDRLPATDQRHDQLHEPIEVLRNWDHFTSAGSVATAVAIFWGEDLIGRKGPLARDAEEPVYDFLVDHVTDDERLDALTAATLQLTRDFGTWRTAWGDINRFQRLNDDILPSFDDARSSLPVGFAPSQWGALASFDWVRPRTTKKIYGSIGNSFVATVEFGPTVHAKAIMSGGESGNPASPHFLDQALMFSLGQFRDVLFTRADVAAHAQRRYHPGQELSTGL